MPCKEIINKILDNDVYGKLEKQNPTSGSKILSSIHIQNNIFINSKENGYKCLICNIIYKHSQTLSNHKKFKHPNYESDIQNNEINEKSEIETLKELFMTQINKLEEK